MEGAGVMDDPSLECRQVRQVYLITYSQANEALISSREEFSDVIRTAFHYPKNAAKVLQWVCAQERHLDGTVDYHMAVKLDHSQRWLHIRNFLQRENGIKVHFSSRHCNYYGAWKYVTKEDAAYIQSDGHQDLANTLPPKTARASLVRASSRVPQAPHVRAKCKAPIGGKKHLERQDVHEPLRTRSGRKSIRRQDRQETVTRQDSQETVTRQEAQEPVTRQEAHEPVRGLNAHKPVRRQNVQEPVRRQNAEEPVRRQNAQEPVRRQNAQEPVRRQNAQEPVRRQNAQEPVRRQNAEEPVRRQNAEEPVRRQNAQEPVRRQNAHEPVRGQDAHGPVRKEGDYDHDKPVKRRKTSRLTAFEVSQIAVSRGIKTRHGLLAFANKEKLEGRTELAEFIINRGHKAVENALQDGWEIERAPVTLEHDQRSNLTLRTVQQLLQQMQDNFQNMSDRIIGRIDEMGTRIDDLEKNIAELMMQAGVDEPQEVKQEPK